MLKWKAINNFKNYKSYFSCFDFQLLSVVSYAQMHVAYFVSFTGTGYQFGLRLWYHDRNYFREDNTFKIVLSLLKSDLLYQERFGFPWEQILSF